MSSAQDRWYWRNHDREKQKQKQRYISQPKPKYRCLTCGIKLASGRVARMHIRLFKHRVERTYKQIRQELY